MIYTDLIRDNPFDLCDPCSIPKLSYEFCLYTASYRHSKSINLYKI